MEYGYARVSARGQNLSRQLDAFRQVGLREEAIYADKASGRDFERPAYRRLMRRVRAGDVIYVKSIDRLGRDYEEVIEEWRRITRDRLAHIVVLDIPILDTRTEVAGVTGVFLTDIVLQVLSYVAQVEHENICQRQAEGIASARARGVRFGRPRIERPEAYGETKARYLTGEITRKEAAARLGVSASTFDNWLRRDAGAEC